MYKYELHVHSRDVSPCAAASAGQIVDSYLAQGYDGLALTNHWSKWVLWEKKLTGMTAEELADFYTEGFLRVREAAAGRLRIFYGIELTLDGASNDYLVYGIDRDFVRDLGATFWERGVDEVARMVHERGGLIYQAHPFRHWSTLLAPSCFRTERNGLQGDLDGLESINYGNSDLYANDVAMNWAKEHGIRTICGADYHNTGMRAVGGIFSGTRIGDDRELVALLRSGEYTLSYYGAPIAALGELHPEKRFTK